ncbi:MAG TPA: LuxR C-terminal-related transcriptional regulator, partial [Amycolatopsis sp.]|nr:LuxR C-terminal-related transcriptional regulator [Amycolatopsis sp.]
MIGHVRTAIVVQHQNRLVRELLATYLTRQPDLVLEGTVASGPELVELCGLKKPGVAVFEADAPRWSNERLVRQVLEAQPNLRMIGVHEALPASYVIRAYQCGVSAVVTYTRGLDTLAAAIRAPSPAIETARAEAGTGRRFLTERELEVLYLISAGYPPRQVALELGISVNTVEHHKQRIFAKLDVHSQAHAAASALRLGLLSHVTAVPAPARSASPVPRVYLAATRRGTGPLAERALKLLREHDIPVLDVDGLGIGRARGEGPVTVLVDPAPADWTAVAHRHGRVVLLVSTEPRPDQLADAVAGGATIVPAALADRLLVPAVRAAGQGYVMIGASQARMLLHEMQGNGGGSRRWQLALTPREQEIVGSIGRGHSSKQTARLLGISVRTVENLQSNL